MYSILPEARGLRHEDHSPCGRRYRPQTTLPHPTLRAGLGVSLGSPFPTYPLALTSLTKSPVFRIEDSNGMRKVACSCWPHPRSAASQSPSRGGQVYLECRCLASSGSGPYSGLAPTISGMTDWHLRQGLPGARFPVGLCTLQVIHQVIPQPSHHLLRACLPLMGPFRSMLLTP